MSTSPEAPPLSRLTPHHDHCFVCGPASPSRAHLELGVGADGALVGEVLLDDRHQGVPGIAHGGAIAAVVDEVAGSVLTAFGVRFVTASLTTTYHARVMTGDRLGCAARIEEVQGRKRTVVVELTRDGGLVASGRALCVDVAEDHFARLGVGAHAIGLFDR